MAQQIIPILPEMTTRIYNPLQSSANTQASNHNPCIENPTTYPPELFNNANPKIFTGTEDAMGLVRWVESIESIFDSTRCPEYQKVEMAASTFRDEALIWWDSEKQIRGPEGIKNVSWQCLQDRLISRFFSKQEIWGYHEEFYNLIQIKGDNKAYNTRFCELSILVPTMVNPITRGIAKYIEGLPLEVRVAVIAKMPDTLEAAIHHGATISEEYAKAGQFDRKDEGPSHSKPEKKSKSSRKKRKRSRNLEPPIPAVPLNQVPAQRGVYVGSQPLCGTCNYHHPVKSICRLCVQCGRYGHLVCRETQHRKNPTTSIGKTCYTCGAVGHIQRQCPNNQTKDAPTSLLLLGAPETQAASTEEANL